MNSPDRQPIFKTNHALLYGHLPFSIALNDASTLPGPRDEIKKRTKDEILVLANSYVSLATFVAPEELETIRSVRRFLSEINTSDKETFDKWLENPLNKKIYQNALDIYNRVTDEIEAFKEEVSKIDFI